MKAKQWAALAAAAVMLAAVGCDGRGGDPTTPSASGTTDTSTSITSGTDTTAAEGFSSDITLPESLSENIPGIDPTSTSMGTKPSVSGVGNSTSAAQRSSSTRSTQGSTRSSASAAAGKYQYDYEGVSPAVAAYNPDTWYLLLVNRDYALPAGYSPETAVCLPGVYGENRELDARVAPEYRKMYYAALKDGAELVPYSGHRRSSTQKRNFDNKIAYYRNQGYSNAQAVNLAAKSILPPGCSEHEAGLAMDITRPGVWDIGVDFEGTKEFAWLMENAADYGFILRYPKDKQDITKITYEPWHWRYVGVKAAKEIKARGVCLEEYLGAL